MKNNIDISQLIDGYLAGKSCVTLALEHGCYPTLVNRMLIDNGVTMRKKWEGRTFNMPDTQLSEFEQQLIDGCLLGDGSVLCRNSRSTAYFTLTSIHKEFVYHLSEILPFRKMRIRLRESEERKIRGTMYNCRASYDVTTTADKVLNSYRNNWYPNGVKIIPKNLKLSPTTLKYWFYGDGLSSYIPYKDINHAYVRVGLCTNGFSMEDCEFLIFKLQEIGFKFKIYLTSLGHPTLNALKTETVRNFFNYMGECTLPCFSYKWKYPEMARSPKTT